MILWLSDSLLNEIHSDCTDEIIISALENLALSYREGKHLLLGHLPVISRIEKLPNLSAKARASIQKIRQNLVQYGSLASNVKIKVEIVPSDYPNVCLTGLNNSSILQIPISKFADSIMVQVVLLLSENITDATFYEFIGKIYITKKRYSNIPLRFETRGGGGSQVVNEYEHIQNNNNRICYCIIDSDKKFPKGRIGEVAQRMERANDNTKICTQYKYFKIRKIENLLSCKQLSEVCRGSSLMSYLNFIEWLEKQNFNEFRHYIDFKHGINVEAIEELPTDNEEKLYYCDILKKIRSDYCKGAALNGFFPGLGDNILRNTFDIIKNQSLHKVTETLCELTSPIWDEIGEYIFAWGLGVPIDVV